MIHTLFTDYSYTMDFCITLPDLITYTFTAVSMVGAIIAVGIGIYIEINSGPPEL